MSNKKIPSFKSKIGGVDHYVSVIDLKTKVENKTPPVHNILVIDRSGSMYYSLSRLIDAVIETIDNLDSADRFSVLWYSGVGQHGKILTNINKESADYKDILQKYKTTVGMTCFSEGVAEAAEIANKYNDTEYTVVTLFTDGQPVVSWSDAEEIRRCVESITSMKNVTAFNSIGYGNYYNRDFLMNLSNASSLGKVYHESKIEDFLESYRNIINGNSGFVTTPIKVTSNNSDIIYANDFTSISKDNVFELDRLSSKSEYNRFFTVSETKSDVSVDTEIEYDLGEVSSEIKTDFFYTFAYQLYYVGKRMKALDIIVNNVRDKHLADKMMNAFTVDEVSDVIDLLNNAARNESGRYLEGKCGAGYLPRKDAFCLIDLLNMMIESEDAAYLPLSKNVDAYKKIGRTVTDTHNRFEKSDEEVVAPVNDFIWNEERLNLSVAFTIHGHVKLNPKAAKSNGLEANYPSRIMRTHTFIKDGQLNIPQAEFALPDTIVNELTKNKVKFKVNGTIEVNGNLINLVVINLKSLPLINRMYIEDVSLDNLYNTTNDILYLKAYQKVLNDLLKKAESTKSTFKKEGEYKTLTLDQIRVLEEHGIRKDGIYGGINNEKPKAEDSDSYQVRRIEFYMKGGSTLPTIGDFEKMLKGDKKVNLPGQMMIDAYNDITQNLKNKGLSLDNPNMDVINYLRNEKKNLKKSIGVSSTDMSKVKLAKYLNRDFFPGLDSDSKGNYIYEKTDGTMVLVNAYVNEYVDIAA